MVLDHLVVQQMGKESEEGDVDSMLLHGTKALYEAEENGVAPSDVVYNSTNVDELIDKLEQEAEEEAKAMEERAKATTEDGEKRPVESMSFAFAKIWEAGQNALQEVEEEEEEVEDVMGTWQGVVDRVAQEKAAAEAAARSVIVQREILPAKRSRKTIVQYKIDGAVSDESPSGKGPKKRRKSGKLTAGETSDTEYYAMVQSDTDDSEVSDLYDGLAEGHDGQLLPARSLVGVTKLSKHEQRLVAAANAASTAGTSATAIQRSSADAQAHVLAAGQVVSASQLAVGDGALTGITEGLLLYPKKRPNETPEETRVRREARRAVREMLARAKVTAAAERVIAAGAPTPAPTVAAAASKPKVPRTKSGQISKPNGNGQSHGAVSMPTTNGNGAAHMAIPQNQSQSNAGANPMLTPHAIDSSTRYAEAREIIQWLFTHLREFHLNSQVAQWATMTLPEVKTQHRKNIYIQLARAADDQLLMLRQEKYYMRPEQLGRVFDLFDAGISAVSESETSVVPSIPAQAKKQRKAQAPPASSQATVPPPLQIAAPAPKKTAKRAKMASAAAQPVDPIQCAFCVSDHPGKRCDMIPTEEDLNRFVNAIETSDEPASEKVGALYFVAHAC
jgi:sugar-specific transcriptional regulator TrmB